MPAPTAWRAASTWPAARSFTSRGCETAASIASAPSSTRRTRSTLRTPASAQHPPRELEGDDQEERGEAELERSLRHRVRDEDPGQHAERRERAHERAVAEPDVAVARLAPRARERDRHDREQGRRLGVELALAEEDRERRDEQDPAADAEQAAHGAAGETEHRCEHVVHSQPLRERSAGRRPPRARRRRAARL